MNLDKVKELIEQYWTDKSKKFKTMVISSSIMLIALIGVFIYLYSRESYEFLLTAPDDVISAKIIQKLDEDNIKYDVREGNKFYVSGVKANILRLQLTGDGVLTTDNSSMDLFKETLFISEEQEATLLKKDLENDISGAIKSYSEVNDAKVIITMGEKSSFKNDSIPAKAAIQLKLKSKLSNKQIASIQSFVAASVPQLDVSDVVITDTDNNLLSSNLDEDNSIEGNSAYTKSLEDKLSGQIGELLSVAFPSNSFKVISRVEVNFDKSTIERHEVQSGPDTVVSKEKTKEKTTNSSGKGQAGVESNVNSYATPNGNVSSSEKTSEIVNYELNKVTEQIVKSPEIKKLSVSVIANRELSAVETAKIEELVQTAALIDSKRGDRVSVQGFNIATEEEETDESFFVKNFDKLLDKSVLIVLLIVILIIILRIISAFKKTKELKLDMDDENSDNYITQVVDLEDTADSHNEELTDGLESIFNKGNTSMEIKKREIVKEISNNPSQVAFVFKEWKKSEHN